MKNIATIAAFAALAALAAPGSASAYTLSPDDFEVCRMLELAHESTCSEYEGRLRDQALAETIDALEATGSTAPAPASYIPYVNGAGDPDGLTRSNRQFPVSAR